MFLEDTERFKIIHGDCIPEMRNMPENSIDFSVFSPPFPSTFAYTNMVADIGNSEELKSEAKLHLSFFYRSILRLIKPGRVMAVHCSQIKRLKRSGELGMFDFRGLLIRLGQRAGFTYEYDWLITKDPQSQAIRTKARSLQFAGLEADRAQCRGAMGDYIILFSKPGANAVPVDSIAQVTRNDWIQWAEAAWTDIRQTDTLNVSEGRDSSDTKHICPLQLGVINRLIRMYSNPDEIILTPFCGIGSEVYMALKLGRRGIGIELKDSYYEAAIRNCQRAETMASKDQLDLFSAPKPEAITTQNNSSLIPLAPI